MNLKMFVMQKKGEIFYVAMQEFNFQNFLFENLFLRTSYTSSISKVHFSEATERESFLLTTPPSSEIVALWETVYVALW